MKLKKIIPVVVALLALALFFWLVFDQILYAIKKAKNKKKNDISTVTDDIESRALYSGQNIVESIFNVYNEKDATPFREHKNFHHFPKNCGIVKNTARVQHGEKAELLEFPWIVSFFGENNSSSFCGGSLISESLIITAHHCMSSVSNRV